MTDLLNEAYKVIESKIGMPVEPTEWFQISQERVNRFAEITLDDQWIHTDPERAKSGPYGATIVHGQLTLSLIELLPREDKSLDFEDLEGLGFIVNYGFNKVRFPAPVIVGRCIRVRSELKSVEIKGRSIETVTEQVVEVEGEAKPACIAQALARYFFD